jgi:peptide/nickel transport system substrate-binding protein
LADRKVFKKNYVGVSDYKITKIDADAYQVHSLSIYSKKDKKIIRYVFKDTQEEVKSAYVLGEVSNIIDIASLEYPKTSSLASFKNTDITRNINPDKLVTVFFNNLDPVLSDKKLRKALAYSLSDKFPEGVRTYTPYRKSYWFNNASINYNQDLSLAKEEIEGSSASSSGKITINLKTLPQYNDLAGLIAKDWKKIGISTKIEVTETVPDNYQAFLGDLSLPRDPDQYTLWHSGAQSNITNYKSLRIDKLLEDGRRIYDKSQRKQIYDDFQKYLVDDMPAAFLYFPYTYDLTRK